MCPSQNTDPLKAHMLAYYWVINTVICRRAEVPAWDSQVQTCWVISIWCASCIQLLIVAMLTATRQQVDKDMSGWTINKIIKSNIFKWYGMIIVCVRSCNDILETAPWLGKYFNNFIIHLREEESWHPWRESTQKGNESSLIKHHVMSFNTWNSYTRKCNKD